MIQYLYDESPLEREAMQPKNIEIVVIEDEEDILELIEYHLTGEGYLVTGFRSAEHVARFLEEESPALLIVDRNLPGIEGSDFVRRIRSDGWDTPVIYLTARDKMQDIESGFESGGDDYITKPFQHKELLLRVKALLKRSGVAPSEQISFRDIRMNIASKDVMIAEKEVVLSNQEFQLLQIFVSSPNVAIEREYLRETIWNRSGDAFHDKTINVAINRLKKKIDPENSKNYFVPVWGVGYKMS
jgi:DNA-binding response OmpR family regulator